MLCFYTFHCKSQSVCCCLNIVYGAHGDVCTQMPFIKKAPRVSFRKPIGSVSVSGHKFIGAPVPCGVVITRQKVSMVHLLTRDHFGHLGQPLIADPYLLCVLASLFQGAALLSVEAGMTQYPADVRSCLQYVAALSNDVEYLNSRDATIMGSRNGHAPIYMWFTLTRKGYEGMRKDVERCLRNAHLLKVPPTRETHVSQQQRARRTAADRQRVLSQLCCACIAELAVPWYHSEPLASQCSLSITVITGPQCLRGLLAVVSALAHLKSKQTPKVDQGGRPRHYTRGDTGWHS